MGNFLEIRTTKRSFGDTIIVNISDEACAPFGFRHKEMAIRPDKLKALIMGVAPGNEGDNVLWYIIIHPSVKNEACYWGGAKNLLEAGFKKVEI